VKKWNIRKKRRTNLNFKDSSFRTTPFFTSRGQPDAWDIWASVTQIKSNILLPVIQKSLEYLHICNFRTSPFFKEDYFLRMAWKPIVYRPICIYVIRFLKNKTKFSYNKENFRLVKYVWNMECSFPDLVSMLSQYGIEHKSESRGQTRKILLPSSNGVWVEKEEAYILSRLWRPVLSSVRFS